MPVQEHLKGQWREWRHARVAELTRPYGWTALVAQYWLKDGEEGTVLDLLPGTWGVNAGKVIYTPTAEGPTLSVDGSYPSGPVEIIPGRNQTYGHGKSVPVYFGDLGVETIGRTDDDGDNLYAVRVRDPRESARKDFSNIEAYDYDTAWRVAASFTPTARRDIETVTVETGVRETTTRIGVLTVELGGDRYELAVIGKDSAAGIVPVVHVRDVTSGDTTYGAGRVLELDWVDEAKTQIDLADFNYLTPLPCAFTNFVTCPIPPQENHLRLAVTAGEKRPEVTLERVLTYAG